MVRVPAQVQDSPGTYVPWPLPSWSSPWRFSVGLSVLRNKLPVYPTHQGEAWDPRPQHREALRPFICVHCIFLGAEPSLVLFPLPEIPFSPLPGWHSSTAKPKVQGHLHIGPGFILGHSPALWATIAMMMFFLFSEWAALPWAFVCVAPSALN